MHHESRTSRHRNNIDTLTQQSVYIGSEYSILSQLGMSTWCSNISNVTRPKCNRGIECTKCILNDVRCTNEAKAVRNSTRFSGTRNGKVIRFLKILLRIFNFFEFPIGIANRMSFKS